MQKRPMDSSHGCRKFSHLLHGFGISAKKRLPVRLAVLALYGWMPLAAALFGTVKWQPQWLHHNFLPVVGLRVHAKVPPSSLTDRQLVALAEGRVLGRPSWWARFWQLARLLKTELLLLVIIRHLHLRPSRSSVS